jgi:hypothetical protein
MQTIKHGSYTTGREESRHTGGSILGSRLLRVHRRRLQCDLQGEQLDGDPAVPAATLGAVWGEAAPTPVTSAAQGIVTARRAEVTYAPVEDRTEVPATWTTTRAATGE